MPGGTSTPRSIGRASRSAAGRRRIRSQRCCPRPPNRPPLALDPGPVRQRHPRLFRPVRGASAAHCRSFDHGGRMADPRRQGNRPRPHHRRRRTRACRRLRQCQVPHRDGPLARARSRCAAGNAEGLVEWSNSATKQGPGSTLRVLSIGDMPPRRPSISACASPRRAGDAAACRERRGGLAQSHTPAAARSGRCPANHDFGRSGLVRRAARRRLRAPPDLTDIWGRRPAISTFWNRSSVSHLVQRARAGRLPGESGAIADDATSRASAAEYPPATNTALYATQACSTSCRSRDYTWRSWRGSVFLSSCVCCSRRAVARAALPNKKMRGRRRDAARHRSICCYPGSAFATVRSAIMI